MLGFIKKVAHRGDDMDDIRSHVLSNRFSPEFPPEPEQGTVRERFDMSSPFPQQQEPEPRFEARYGEPPPGQFSEPMQMNEKPNRDYDILDRLNLIESQLAAVRSMTETINERLKNMEVKLGTRRY